MGMIIMKKVETGDMRLDQSIHLEPADLDGLTEEAFNDPSKTTFTVEYLMVEMLQNSSNVAYRALKRQVSSDEQKTIVEAVGLDELFDNDGKVSSKDYSRLFRALYLASYLNVEHSQKLLDLLASGNHETLLRSGLPTDIRFAHKWGTNIAINVYSDAGIVYLENKPYLISVMVAAKNLSTAEAESRVNKLMDEISRKAYVFMSEGYLQ
jgi:beta-lactamase class A